MGIRRALGASRGRLLWMLAHEALLLSLLGGALGVLLTFQAARLMPLLVSVSPLQVDPAVLSLTPDARLVAFALAASLATAVLVTLAPALLPMPVLASAPHGGPAAGGGRRLWARGTLVVIQQALSLALLIAAGLFIRTWQHFQDVDPGFDAESVVAATIEMPAGTRSEAEKLLFYDRLLATIRALPRVEAASLGHLPPLYPGRSNTWVRYPGMEVPDDRPGINVDYRAVSPDYFETLGIPLLGGRGIERRDTAAAPRVAVVNETIARRFWGQQDAVGQRFEIPVGKDVFDTVEVVGVVRDSKYLYLDETPRLHMYLPLTQRFRSQVSLHARASDEPGLLLPEIRQAIHDLDPRLPVFDPRTLDEQVARSMGGARAAAELVGVFALVAFFLAAVGLYAALAYDVRQRHHELGVRMALGARGADLVGLVLGRGLRLVALGTGFGLIVALALGELIASELYGVTPADPITFIAFSGLLLGVGMAATYLPARRASRLDPVEVLRYE